MSQNTLRKATAFAPATVANVAVGFDLLGFSMSQAGDRVTVERDDDTDRGARVVVESVTESMRDAASGATGTGGTAAGTGAADIPLDAAKNTAAVALQAMIDELKLQHGSRISIEKGIPLGSGMGGSAASAVGAVVAANALLERPLPPDQLLGFALAGETVASGSAHADNTAPCLYGGLTLAFSLDPLRIIPIPTPSELQCVLVHPHLKIEIKRAREILKPTLLLQEHVHQSAYLAAFVSACHRGDVALISASMIDLVVEPQRASLIPGFYEAKRAAIEQGALGFSISGSGPSVFAWAASKNAAERVRMALLRVFEAQRIGADSWIAQVAGPGARLNG